MTSNSSSVPLHESVGRDPNNWTTLSNKEAKIRAKAVEKGHAPHDWRWAFKKVFKTNKVYPESLRPVIDDPNVPSGNEDSVHTSNTSRFQNTTDMPPVSNQPDRRQEGGHFSPDHSATASHSHHVVDASLGSNLLGHQQRDGPIMAPENAPELAGGRDRASEVQTNVA